MSPFSNSSRIRPLKLSQYPFFQRDPGAMYAVPLPGQSIRSIDERGFDPAPDGLVDDLWAIV
jgi:hypothetical protein